MTDDAALAAEMARCLRAALVCDDEARGCDGIHYDPAAAQGPPCPYDAADPECCTKPGESPRWVAEAVRLLAEHEAAALKEKP